MHHAASTLRGTPEHMESLSPPSVPLVDTSPVSPPVALPDEGTAISPVSPVVAEGEGAREEGGALAGREAGGPRQVSPVSSDEGLVRSPSVDKEPGEVGT